MTKLNQVYKCEVCGNIVEVAHEGVGVLVCCGQPMALQSEKKEDLGQEKHVPVLTKSPGKITVKVGSVGHPMEENHFIEWIEIIADSISFKKFLKPGEKPVAEFAVSAKNISARAYCNIHGLWKA